MRLVASLPFRRQYVGGCFASTFNMPPAFSNHLGERANIDTCSSHTQVCMYCVNAIQESKSSDGDLLGFFSQTQYSLRSSVVSQFCKAPPGFFNLRAAHIMFQEIIFCAWVIACRASSSTSAKLVISEASSRQPAIGINLEHGTPDAWGKFLRNFNQVALGS